MDAFELLVDAHRPAMRSALARLVEVFRVHGVRYVIGGAAALSLYVRPRMTVDIDAFVDPAHKEALEQVLAEHFELVSIGRYHSKFRQADVDVDILYAGARAEDFALAHPHAGVILGTPVQAASPEALLWLYLVSEKEINYADAIALLRAMPDLDHERVRVELERDDRRLIEKLERMLATAREPEASYEASRSRRS